MGTNYYSVKRDVDFESEERFWDLRGTEDCIHIGKSSVGWCFSLHVMPERGINSLTDWIHVFIDPERIIIDEYRDVVSLTEMMGVITARGRPERCAWSSDKMAQNFAVLGPNNLVRHRIEPHRNRGCIAHGEGTWDLIVGSFS